MGRVKQFSAALVAAVLAVGAVIVGILALTVWRPADQVVATATPSEPYVMTRDQVLPLLGSDVTVTVTDPQGREVSLVYGTTADVIGWIGQSGYTEVVGLEASRTTLKTVDHPAAAGSGAQSGAQSGDEQSGDEQSGAAAQGAQSGAVPTGNDMWLQESDARGTTSMTLTDVPAGRSVLAAVDGGADAPALTLTWAVQPTNVGAIVAFVLAALLLVLAVVLLLSRLRVLRHRNERAHRLEEARTADSTDTQLISVEAVAAEGLAGADASSPRAVPEGAGRSEGVDGSGTTRGSGVDGVPGRSSAPAGPAGEGAPAGDEDAAAAGDEDGSAAGDDGGADDFGPLPQWGDIMGGEPPEAAPGEVRPGPSPDGSDDAATGDGHGEGVDRASLAGRHGLAGGPLDEDPPERVPTDSGVIDVSAIRAGMAFPSRRALREAREKGQDHVVIDGHEFDTGVVPRVDGATGGADRGGESEPDAPDRDTGTSERGSWTSLMAGWKHRDRTGEDDGKDS